MKIFGEDENELEKEKEEQSKEETVNEKENIEEEKQEEKKKEEQEEETDEFSEFEKWIEEQQKKRNKKPYFTTILLTILIISGMMYLFYTYNNESGYTKEISYTEFVNDIKNDKYERIIEKDGYLYATPKNKMSLTEYKTKSVTQRIGNDTELMKIILDKNISLKAENPPAILGIVATLLNFLPLGFLIFFFIYTSSMMRKNGGDNGIFGIGTTISKVSEIPKVSFKDIAGVDEAKEELREVVEFLKTPEKFIKAGAKIPKGILLEGDPGTGKTLLAKAVAGESGSAFFTMSGSEFVEMYVGVGASRVRKLFKEAKANKPAIVFIDEIDAVGRSRSNSHSSNDEREQTLNQLLVEMDGFGDNENVIVIAATNRVDVLDGALTRSGRFDRKVRVEMPDMESRLAILKVHSRGKRFSNDVKLEDIARITPGFSGADLANILNEAAILAARNDREIIEMKDLDEAVDKLGLGLGKKNKKVSEKMKKLLAYHEGGHALIASLLEDADKVHKVTIIGRGNAGGYMMPLPNDSEIMTRTKILADMKVTLGGRAAEEVALDDISVGASNDISSVTRWANYLIRNVGMDNLFGPVNLEENRESFKNNLSDGTNREIELKVRELIQKLYKETVELIQNNRELLDKIADYLILKETITGSEVRALVSGKTIEEVSSMSLEELDKYY